jgi:uncharacterized protein (TIGR03435 family)
MILRTAMRKVMMPVIAGMIAIFIVPLCAAVQDLPTPRSFEVATVRPSPPKCVLPNVEMVLPSGRLTIGCQPLTILVRLAYLQTLQGGDVTGGPKWAQTDLYDITAKVDQSDMSGWSAMSDTGRRAAVRPLLQELLAKRFKLKTHTEMRVTTVYALVQSKGGAKLKKVDWPQPTEDNASDDETKASPPVGGFKIAGDRMVARAEQMPKLLWFFMGRSGYEDAPFVDKTGLEGYYDFEMKLPEVSDKAEFELQLEKQLGLKIRVEKSAIPVVVIDGAEKPADEQE